MSKLACFFVLISSAAALQAQSGRIQFNWDKFAAKAVEKVDISLEGPMLEMASKFLGDDESKVKQIVQSLKGIYVKSFTFDKEGQYTEADLNQIRAQLRAPEWSKIVDVQDKHESSTVYLKTDGKQTQGIVVLAAEGKELTVVQILGPIDPSMLSDLGGVMGIPKTGKPKPGPVKKDD